MANEIQGTWVEWSISIVHFNIPVSCPPGLVQGGQRLGFAHAPLYLQHLTVGRQPINIYRMSRKFIISIIIPRICTNAKLAVGKTTKIINYYLLTFVILLRWMKFSPCVISFNSLCISKIGKQLEFCFSFLLFRGKKKVFCCLT